MSDRIRRSPEERSEIIQRYVAEENGSEALDLRYAAEIGLTVDSIRRMAKDWLSHRDPNLIKGAKAQETEIDRLAAIEAAKKPNLRNVDPARRQEIIHKIGVIRRHLEIGEPTEADEDAGSRDLGVSRKKFREIVRSWTLNPDPTTLPRASRRRRRMNGMMTVRPEVSSFIGQAIAEMGIDASSLKIHKRVADLCMDAGLKTPSNATVYYRLMEARALQTEKGSDTIAVDHFAVSIAVDGANGTQMPIASIVFQKPTGRVVAHYLSLDPPDHLRTAKILLSALKTEEDHPMEVPLLMGRPPEPEWDMLNGVLVGSGVEMGRDCGTLRPGRLATRTFGTRLGNLNIRPRFTMNPMRTPSHGLKTDRPIDMDEAHRAMDDAVLMHNESRAVRKTSFCSGTNREKLIDSLERIGLTYATKL